MLCRGVAAGGLCVEAAAAQKVTDRARGAAGEQQGGVGQRYLETLAHAFQMGFFQCDGSVAG